MLRTLMMTAVGTAMLASGALAASDPPSMRDASKADPRNPRFEENTFQASAAMNKRVVDMEGDSVGTIRDFFVDSDGRVFAIVEVERLLAVDTFLAVPYRDLQVKADASGKMSEDMMVETDDKMALETYFNMKYGESKTTSTE